MRLILAVPEYPPDNIGGGGEVAAALHQEYLKTDEVTVIAGRIGLRPVSASPGVHWIDEWPFPRGMSFTASTMPPTPRGLRDVSRLVKNADAIHLHGYGFPVMDIVARLARRRGIPYVHTLHGFPVTPAKAGGLVGAAFAVYSALLGDRTLMGAHSWTSVSRSVADLYHEKYGLQPHVVPNGVRVLERIARTRRDEHFHILCVGRIEWIKDFKTVARALAMLPDDFRLTVAGRDNGALDDLQAEIAQLGLQDRVDFVGFLDRTELAQAFANADCCVMSSVTEAFPGVPLEAMSQSVPLISTPVGGIAEYGVDGDNMLLFDPGDVTGLARALARLRDDDALRLRLIEGGERTALRYSWKNVAAEYRSLLATAAATK